MPTQSLKLEFTKHAIQVMEERSIPMEWVVQAIAKPALRIPDPHDPQVERFFRRIPEQDDRVLRVVANTHVTPWRVVSAFFDRSMREKL